MKKFTFLFVFAVLAMLIPGSFAFGQIAQKGIATSATSTNTNLTIAKPVGVVAGDVMIANIAKANNNSNASLAGWTVISGGAINNGGNIRATLLYKVAGGSEPANYTFVLGAGANDAVGSIVAFTGVDGSGPFDVAPGSMSLSTSTSTTATATAITTVTANAAVVMFTQASDNNTWSAWNTTSPGSLWEINQTTFNSSQDLSVGAAFASKAVAGSTGSGTATQSGTDYWGAMLIALKPAVVAPPPVNLWATSSDGERVSGFSVSTGNYMSGPADIFDPFPSSGSTTAALGRNDKPSIALGHFYWLPNSGTNGVVNVYAATSTGASITNIGSLDVNGASSNTLGFVRLGMSADGTGWILAGDGTTVYLAKFLSNGVNPVTITVEDASVSLVGGTAATFNNGDICLDGTGRILALGNNGGTTQIFVGMPAGAGTTLTKKFDVLDENSDPFSGSVNGVAFDAQGSLYVSASDGLYYINKTTVNGPAATISIAQVWVGSGLQDLASNVFPTTIITPVKLGTFTVTKQGTNSVLNWTTLTEANSDHFEIERSYDGINFTVIGTKQAAGTSNSEIAYQYTDAINTASKIIYYRLKTVDADAKSSMSKIVALRLGGTVIKDFTVYPNPFTSDLKVQVSSDKQTDITIRISNAAGQQVVNRKVMVQTGENVIVLSSELSTLQSGIYMMEVITEEGKKTQKIIKR